MAPIAKDAQQKELFRDFYWSVKRLITHGGLTQAQAMMIIIEGKPSYAAPTLTIVLIHLGYDQREEATKPDLSKGRAIENKGKPNPTTKQTSVSTSK